MPEVQVFINQTFVTCENHTIASKTLFNNEWICDHASMIEASRNAAIAAVLQHAQVINPTDIKLITSRTKRRMASRRSNLALEEKKSAYVAEQILSAAKRARIEVLAPPPPAEYPPLNIEVQPGQASTVVVIGTFKGKRLFEMKGGNQGLWVIEPNLYDHGQFLSGVIIREEVVVKFLTEKGGGRFKLPNQAVIWKKKYYEKKRKHNVHMGYSDEVEHTKITEEIAAMRQIHNLKMSPAIYCSACSQGNMLLIHNSLALNILP